MAPKRSRPTSRSTRNDDYDYYGGDAYGGDRGGQRGGKGNGKSGGKSGGMNPLMLALFGGIFILGIGVGIAFSSTATVSERNVANREFLDRNAPNPEVCVQFGASAMVVESRSYVTLNPFNVYISQPRIVPGCVMRSNNWSVLERAKAVTPEEVRDCKNRLNTFGFTGNLEDDPLVQCIYQNDGEDNQFRNNPGVSAPAPEGERF
ncbi:MAG: DUF3172 domain-containing protein [Geitlerinemataceae cyanobacterium]